MSFFGGYSKRGRQLEEQDKKFLEFKKQMSDQNIVFEKGDYLAMGFGGILGTLAGTCHYTGSNCGDQPVLFIKNCKNLKGRMNGLYQEGINTKKNSLAANR